MERLKLMQHRCAYGINHKVNSFIEDLSYGLRFHINRQSLPRNFLEYYDPIHVCFHLVFYAVLGMYEGEEFEAEDYQKSGYLHSDSPDIVIVDGKGVIREKVVTKLVYTVSPPDHFF